MPWWVIADTSSHKRALFGPYTTESRAEEIKDDLDDGHAMVYETGSSKRSEASREIRHRRAEEDGVDAVYKNFSHKGATAP